MSSTEPRLETSLYPFFRSLESLDARGGDLQLSEEAGLRFLILRGASGDAGFSDVAKQVLGAALPRASTRFGRAGGRRVFWVSPDEWIVVVPDEEFARIEGGLQTQLKGHYALVDASGGFSLITLSGGAAENLLKKSGAYDFQQQNLPVGRSVQTVLAATTALISRTDVESFDLVIRRSFADHIARWLIDAGAEYGICVDAPAADDKEVS